MKFIKNFFVILLVSAFFTFMPYVHAEETGTIGEYNTLEEATEAALNAEVDNDEETVTTSIETKEEEFVEDTQVFDDTFDTEDDAIKATDSFKETYIDSGYKEESSVIEKVETEVTETEEKDFNSVQEMFDYRDLLEAAGYEVKTKLVKTTYTNVESNKTDIDRTFNSMIPLVIYTLTLTGRYNNLQLQIEDNSYTVVNTDEDVTKAFNTQREALNYLVSLARQYNVTNPNITYEEVPVEETEHIKQYFETEEAANNAYNNLVSPDYDLENKEIKKLTESEISSDKNNIISNLSLNSDNDRYNGIHGNSVDVTVTTTDRSGRKITSSGTAVINQVTVNGRNHTAVGGISLFNMQNNAVAKVRGTVTYCNNYITVLGARVCTSYKTSNFESYGLVNTDRNSNSALLTDNVFYYSLDSFDDTTNTVKDNLVQAYTLDVDKVTRYTVPTYTVTAHIHSEDTVNQFRLYGTASRIDVIPTYTIEFTKTKTVDKYHATSTMVKKNTKKTYVVNYTMAKKENTAKKKLAKTNNPQTNDNINVYLMYLAISSIGTGYVLTRKNTRLD